jgi:hypothetical protein
MKQKHEKHEKHEKKRLLQTVGKFFRTIWSILSGLQGIVAGVTLLVSLVAGFFVSKTLQPGPSVRRVSSSPSAAAIPGAGPAGGGSAGEGSAGAASMYGDPTYGGSRGVTGGASGGGGVGPAPKSPASSVSSSTSPAGVRPTSASPAPASVPAGSPAPAGPGGQAPAPPAGAAPLAASGTGLAGYALGGQHVLYVDTSRHVQELFLGKGSSKWEHWDQSQLVGAPPAARTSGLAGYTYNGVNYASYVDEQGHVRGLEWTPTVHRPAVDLTAGAQAPPAASGTGLAGYWLGGQHVLYVDASQHVQELFRDKGSSKWEHWDQSQLVGAPPAARTSGLAGYTYNGVNYAAYVDEQGHVQKLEWTPTVHRPAVDLTAGAQAPPAAPGTGLAGYTLGGQHVLYVDVNRHVQALWLGDGAPNWESFDHTAAANVPPAAPGTGLAGYADNGVNYGAYLDEQGHVKGLQWTTNGTQPLPGLTG